MLPVHNPDGQNCVGQIISQLGVRRTEVAAEFPGQSKRLLVGRNLIFACDNRAPKGFVMSRLRSVLRRWYPRDQAGIARQQSDCGKREQAAETPNHHTPTKPRETLSLPDWTESAQVFLKSEGSGAQPYSGRAGQPGHSLRVMLPMY